MTVSGNAAEKTASLGTLGLLEGAGRAGSWAGDDAPVTGICVDSRRTDPGDLFVALPGSNIHGIEFAEYALRMGASAILTDADGAAWLEAKSGTVSVPVVVSQNPRLALAKAAGSFFGAQPEVMVAVTGTNGKTSVASFVRQLWEDAGYRAVSIGTVGVEGAVSVPAGHTTPEPLTLHRLLAQLAEQNVGRAAIEASSHGLAQYRLDGVRLCAAGFTNISRDHLDYHDGFEDYFQAKLGLFGRVLPEHGTAVVNIDGVFGRRVAETAAARGQTLITVGEDAFADLRIMGQRYDALGQYVLFNWNGDSQSVHLDLVGGFQAHNALSAAGLVIGAGSEPAEVFPALGRLRTVRGRMERAAVRGNGAAVFVDYAHTPDAIATALKALRPHVMGRILVVIGAGGDRDRGKRPLMGTAAAENADVAFVTDDNPRSENPASIRSEVLQGCPEATEIGDRAEAILSAVDALQPGDALLIAGKGHETGQIVGDDVLPFDDLEQASVAVAALDGLVA